MNSINLIGEASEGLIDDCDSLAIVIHWWVLIIKALQLKRFTHYAIKCFVNDAMALHQDCHIVKVQFWFQFISLKILAIQLNAS